jgi:hypothetical protein
MRSAVSPFASLAGPKRRSAVSDCSQGKETAIIVLIDKIRTTNPAIALPVVKITRRSAASIGPISAKRSEISRPANRRQQQRRRCSGSRETNVPGRKQARHNRPVNEADRYGDALLGDEVPKRREEASQLRQLFRFSTPEPADSPVSAQGRDRGPQAQTRVRSQAGNAEATQVNSRASRTRPNPGNSSNP